MSTYENIQVLETTLRDGSYVIDFQFTAHDTAILSQALERLGFEWIEIGHGIGINASATKGQAAASDQEYIQAAKTSVSQAKIGMFCIPGIASLKDIKACADAGLDFIRIGSNVDQVASTKEFIEAARSFGLFVCTNFMKSYALEPKEFAKVVHESASYGSQMVYLVDSAGGMLPQHVREYIHVMASETDLPIGFHGHNNLHLAVANSLAAIEAGAQVVDTTLLGMGRSSGNAATEVVVPLVQKLYDSCKHIDSVMLLDLAHTTISPFVKRRWEDSERTALGLSQVHSMYSRPIKKAAKEHEKSLFSLIDEVGKRDKLNLPDTVLESSLAEAKPKGFLTEKLGHLSLIENLNNDSSTEDIIRVAVKLNVPILLKVVDTGERYVSLERDVVFLCCSEDEAKSIENHPDSARKIRRHDYQF